MGPRKPEIEYINLELVGECNSAAIPGADLALTEALKNAKKLADGALTKGPYSITKDKKDPHVAASGDIHDFLSYAPYWWPSDKNDGTYIRKDGKRNPDVSLLQDQSQLEGLAEQLLYLCLGYRLYRKDEYADRAVYLLDVFFVDPHTKMNPNVDYGQVVRGSNYSLGGRPDGIIGTRTLAQVANVIPILFDFPGYQRIANPISMWFQNYGQWLLTSDLGQQAAARKNNHNSWYLVQLVMVLSTFGLPTTLGTPPLPPVIDALRHFIHSTLPQQIDMKTGDQPLESGRTRPFHYLVFNLQALIYIAQWMHHQQLKQSGADSLFRCQDIHDYLTKAVDYLVSYDTKKTNEDPTEAIRCVQQMKLRREKTMGSQDILVKQQQRFVDMTKAGDVEGRFSGPKNTIYWLWSR